MRICDYFWGDNPHPTFKNRDQILIKMIGYDAVLKDRSMISLLSLRWSCLIWNIRRISTWKYWTSSWGFRMGLAETQNRGWDWKSRCRHLACLWLYPRACPSLGVSVSVMARVSENGWEWQSWKYSWEPHTMRRHVYYPALQWVPHWELAFDPSQWAGQCILHQTAGEAVPFLFLSTSLPAPLKFWKAALEYSAVFASASSNLACRGASLERKLELRV